ncbi:MAG: DNA topoisomerase IV subunit A [Bacilli bacterium]
MNKLLKMNLEDIMGDRFGKYSKYIIQDRALPDIRDGLKPVQRRILFAMNSDNNTYSNAYRKSAKTVGNVIGNYHPHGDTSVYDAMVRLSQNWKVRETLVEMHGNNGSIDGDSAAAMRYTEARLSKVSSLLLEDIKMNTVDMVYNFDDTLLEPVVLPAKYPNLLVNGASGISAGYATNIPPHNLVEVLNALIYLIKNPNCRVDTLFKYVKGPDFPLGATVSGKKEIEEALTTGKGRVVVKSKYEIEKEKGKHKIVVSEIPYEVNKANLVYKIEEIKELNKVSGISEVRDESDKDGIRIVIELKKDANCELIINYLLKNTDLQTYYNYNMVAIVDRKPKLVGIKEILDAYYTHQVEVLTRKCNFELEKVLKRLHIIEGLVIALDKIDLLIKIIRASSNKKDAIENICNEFDLTFTQSEAIVNLQLYRLTSTDIDELLQEKSELEVKISELREILNDRDILNANLIAMFKLIIKEYGSERKTIIEEVHETIKIDEKDLISNDEVIVTLTKDGYVKKTSLKSYNSSEFEDYEKKDDDYLICATKCFELNYVLAFTSKGNYIVIPVYELAYKKWKELGEHVSNYVLMKSDEEIISAYIIEGFNSNKLVTVFSDAGYAKRVVLSDLNVSRFNKPYMILKLGEGEKLISATFNSGEECVCVSKNGYGLRFAIEEISIQGTKSKGVRAIGLKDDKLVYGDLVHDKYLLILTNENKAKRYLVDEVVKTARSRKGNLIIKKVKSKEIVVRSALLVNTDDVLMRFDTATSVIKASSIAIGNSSNGGSVINKLNVVELSYNYCDVFNNIIENYEEEISEEINNNKSVKNVAKSDRNNENHLKNDNESDIIEEEIFFDEITIDDFLE